MTKKVVPIRSEADPALVAVLKPGELARLAADDEHALLDDGRGKLKACEHNARVLIGSRRSTRGCTLTTSSRACGSTDAIGPTPTTSSAALASVEHDAPTFTLGHARNAARLVAYSRRRDSLREFVDGLPAWDGSRA